MSFPSSGSVDIRSASYTIHDLIIKPEMEVDDVMDAAMHFDACLIKFYREPPRRSQARYRNGAITPVE